MTSKALWQTAFKIARREFRASLGKVRVLLACLALGVAAIAVVGTLKQAIFQGLQSQGAAILGGDAELEFTYRYASGDEWAWMRRKADRVSEIADFRSMATVEGGGGPVQALTQVKAVDGEYPLKGEIILDPAIGIAEALETRGGIPGGIMHQTLAERVGIEPGGRFKLGLQEFRLSALLVREPDGLGGGFSFGPRTIVRKDDLAESGLLMPGTLFESRYRLSLPAGADLEALKGEAMELFRDRGLSWTDRRNGTPGTRSFVNRIAAFLGLVGLAGMAVGGIGVSAAIRTYLEGKRKTIATFKTLGAGRGVVFLAYFMQTLAMSAIGVAIGLLIGAAVPFLISDLVSASASLPLQIGVYAAPLAQAGLYGFLTAMIFGLWPLSRIENIRPAVLFRDSGAGPGGLPRPVYLVSIAGLTALLVALASYLSGLETLTLYMAGGIAVTLGILLVLSVKVSLLAKRMSRLRMLRGWPILRTALGSIGGPGEASTPIVLSLGLGLTVLAAIGQIDHNLRNAIARDLPDVAPAYFFVDIQSGQLAEFEAAAGQVPGVSRIESAPMLRGIITRINGVPAREVVGEHWVLNGDRGITYSASQGEGAVLTEGSWWPEDYSGPPLVSFAEEEGREMGLRIGDKITVNVLGRDLEAEIHSFRVVDFSNAGINFIMSMNPSALAGAPHTHISTVYADREAEVPLLRSVASKFRNITAVGVREVIERISGGLASLAGATSLSAVATLLTGFVVLIGVTAAGERERVYESAILKSVGVRRWKILVSFALRSAILGGVAGLAAVLAGAGAGWWVIVRVMEAEFAVNWLSAFGIVGAGLAVTLGAGILFALRPMMSRPASILRAGE